MNKLIFCAVALLLIGCIENQYYWNPNSGKAGEGRCYENRENGPDVITKTANCDGIAR